MNRHAGEIGIHHLNARHRGFEVEAEIHQIDLTAGVCGRGEHGAGLQCTEHHRDVRGNVGTRQCAIIHAYARGRIDRNHQRLVFATLVGLEGAKHLCECAGNALQGIAYAYAGHCINDDMGAFGVANGRLKSLPGLSRGESGGYAGNA